MATEVILYIPYLYIRSVHTTLGHSTFTIRARIAS